MASRMKVNWPAGDRLIAEYKEKYGEQTLLAFSRGKDSIAAALALRGKLDVIPVHYNGPPELDFINENCRYFEKHLFDRKIIVLPHPVRWSNMCGGFHLQSLSNAEVIGAAQLELLDHEIMRDRIIQETGCNPKIWNAVGVRATDSPMRRMTMEKHGPLRSKTKTWFPVWDWNKARLVEEIERSGISLPIDYLIWGRSFDGLDARFILPMKKHLPADYEKIKLWYPLIDVEAIRYEMHTGEDAGAGFAKRHAALGQKIGAAGGRRPEAVGQKAGAARR